MQVMTLHFLLLSLVLCTFQLKAENRLEFRSVAFYPHSQLFRDIYGRMEIDWQVQASTELTDHLDLWSNFSWLYSKGHSIGFHNRTSINILNSSLGVNYLYSLNCQFTLYFGIGACIGKMWITNHSDFRGNERLTKRLFGGIAKCGIYYYFSRQYYLDLFLDYLYQTVHFPHKRLNIGGIKAGLGLGKLF
jgi:hypothetical protein